MLYYAESEIFNLTLIRYKLKNISFSKQPLKKIDSLLEILQRRIRQTRDIELRSKTGIELG